MKSLIILVALLVVGALSYEKALYNNYQVHKVTPLTDEQVSSLRNVEEQFSFWSDVSGVGKSVHIMVAPHQRSLFEDVVTNINLESELYIEDVQQLIDNEKVATRASNFDFKNYYRLSDVRA